MLTYWQCTARSQGWDHSGKPVWDRCPAMQPEMNLVDGRFLCPEHAVLALEKNPQAQIALVSMPSHLQRKIREAEARQTK